MRATLSFFEMRHGLFRLFSSFLSIRVTFFRFFPDNPPPRFNDLFPGSFEFDLSDLPQNGGIGNFTFGIECRNKPANNHVVDLLFRMAQPRWLNSGGNDCMVIRYFLIVENTFQFRNRFIEDRIRKPGIIGQPFHDPFDLRMQIFTQVRSINPWISDQFLFV
ncbi:hypothetical protein D3C86_1476320 [compost metagenome]